MFINQPFHLNLEILIIPHKEIFRFRPQTVVVIHPPVAQASCLYIDVRLWRTWYRLAIRQAQTLREACATLLTAELSQLNGYVRRNNRIANQAVPQVAFSYLGHWIFFPGEALAKI